MYSVVNCEYLHFYELSMLDEEDEVQLLLAMEDLFFDEQAIFVEDVLLQKIRKKQEK